MLLTPGCLKQPGLFLIAPYATLLKVLHACAFPEDVLPFQLSEASWGLR